MKRNVKFVIPAGLVLAAGLGCSLMMGGCYTANIQKGESLSQIQGNPLPGVQNESQRYVDVNNMYAVTNNDNLRKANNDWNRFWLMDRPSRLSPYPITH
jgi:hypothetical protein